MPTALTFAAWLKKQAKSEQYSPAVQHLAQDVLGDKSIQSVGTPESLIDPLSMRGSHVLDALAEAAVIWREEAEENPLIAPVRALLKEVDRTSAIHGDLPMELEPLIGPVRAAVGAQLASPVRALLEGTEYAEWTVHGDLPGNLDSHLRFLRQTVGFMTPPRTPGLAL